MAVRPAETRQLSFEDVGVIGTQSVKGAHATPDLEVGSGLGKFAADFEKVERPQEDSRPVLPEDFEDWPAFKAANGSARENFEFVIRYPGSVFTAPGRYHNARNLDEIYDVVADQKVPDGMYLFPDNYLVNAAARGAILRAERAPEAAPAQPDPLRPSRRKE